MTNENDIEADDEDTNENDETADEDDENNTDESENESTKKGEEVGEDSNVDDEDSADETEYESDNKCTDCGFLVFCRVSSLMEHEHCRVKWRCRMCGIDEMTTEEVAAHYKEKHEDELDSEVEFKDNA